MFPQKVSHGYSFLQELVKKYSEFINFPIYLWATKEVDVEVPADEDDSSEDEESCMHNGILIFLFACYMLKYLFMCLHVTSMWVAKIFLCTLHIFSPCIF